MDPPPFPPTLLASFHLVYHPGPPPASSIAGSLILNWFAAPYKYFGMWAQGLDNCAVTFEYNLTTARAIAAGVWSAFPNSDYGTWHEMGIRLPPFLLYRASLRDSSSGLWTGIITITS